MNFEKDVSLVRRPLRFLGVWPENSTYAQIKFTVSFTLVFLGVILNARYLFFVKSELEFIETITALMAFTITIIGMSVLKKNRMRMMEILNWMRKNWKNYQYLPEKSKIVMHRQSVISRRIAIIVNAIVASMYFSSTFELFVLSFNSNIYITEVTNEAWFPFTTESSSTIGIVFTIRLLAIACCLAILYNLDTYTILILLHVCGQMKVLCNVINTYEETLRHIATVDDEQELHHCNCLECIVDRHNSLVEISSAMENCINLIIMIKLFGHGIQFIVLGFFLIAGDNNVTSKISTIIIYFVLIICSSFIYGWLGEQLTQHGYEIGNAAYSNNWYEFCQPKIRQALNVIICRSQKPINITAGRYFTMSLKVIGELFLTWLSYLSVLKAVKSSGR